MAARGRPTKFTKELGEKICFAVSTCTDSLAQICEDNAEFPTYKCVNEWRIRHDDFGVMYAKAKMQQADLLAEEIIKIADNTSNDTLISRNKDGEIIEKCNTEWIARSRLKVDARKWIACKLLPKVYGDNNKEQNEDRENLKEALQAIKDIAKKCIQPI